MRVLLINTNTKDDPLAAAPIGLSYVASAADGAGHEVCFLDLCLRWNIFRAIRKSIAKFRPEVIGVSIRNIDNVNMLHPVFYLPEARDIISFIRTLTDVPIVLGGSAVTLNPQGILEFMKADYVVVSDGEVPFVKLLGAFERGETPETIPGVGMIIQGKFHCLPHVLNDFPSGRADVGKWTDTGAYARIGSSYPIQTKRGCAERCIYCTYQIIEGHGIRLRPPRDVVDEIEDAHYRFNPDLFEIVDSVFSRPKDHATEILEEICRRPWKASFTVNGMDPRSLDGGCLDLMWRAGVRSFTLSPESASDSVIGKWGKGFVREDLIRAAEAINKTRLTPFWFFLIGGPGETNETLQETLDFILKYLKHETHPPYHNVNMFMGVRVYPGTRLWTIAMKEGMVNRETDPMQPCWYSSEALDIDLAVEQMIRTAAICPELYLGFDEGYLSVARMASILGHLYRLPKPYWRHLWGLNRLLIKSRLRFAFRANKVAYTIREQLKQQGYSGPLLKNST
ncbi:MAG: cobalamin B12-binding domain-containing protein [Desulfomonile tiedjei]|nr:cobalamin B12-binding domain-containing protein [Desulfomonile tiedjei]